MRLTFSKLFGCGVHCAYVIPCHVQWSSTCMPTLFSILFLWVCEGSQSPTTLLPFTTTSLYAKKLYSCSFNFSDPLHVCVHMNVPWCSCLRIPLFTFSCSSMTCDDNKFCYNLKTLRYWFVSVIVLTLTTTVLWILPRWGSLLWYSNSVLASSDLVVNDNPVA